MWSYYGRKAKIVRHYPSPKYDTIIEPFCGTAVYSLYENNWQKEIILVDKYDVIIKLWKYLQQAKPEDILKLPDIEAGEKVPNYLCDEERWLIGFCINGGSAVPKLTAQKFNRWNSDKVKIAENLYKIKHWKFICDDYKNIDNIEATWFIDPPYQFGGKYYRHKSIDYGVLADWCKDRQGQTIVCENTKADWLDFKPLVELQGQLHKTTEAIWLNNSNII